MRKQATYTLLYASESTQPCTNIDVLYALASRGRLRTSTKAFSETENRKRWLEWSIVQQRRTAGEAWNGPSEAEDVVVERLSRPPHNVEAQRVACIAGKSGAATASELHYNNRFREIRIERIHRDQRWVEVGLESDTIMAVMLQHPIGHSQDRFRSENTGASGKG